MKDPARPVDEKSSAATPHPVPSESASVILLAGPTAVGKTDVAQAIAEANSGEIVSVDSMQVYRGLDIGTAKPSAAQRERVTHHLIDILDLTQRFDAAQFVSRASEVVSGIHARGRRAILCGGTGLYFKAFIEGLGHSPAGDASLRAELESTPLPQLIEELASRDPASYKTIDLSNPRRVIRAIEVIRLTGRPFSEQRADWKSQDRTGSAEPSRAPLVCLYRSPEEMRARIDARVDQMFKNGLVEETKCLLKGGLADNPVALQALGYRQVVAHLRGERSLPETIELVKIKTRQFAKRQMTWFRAQRGVKWIEAREGDLIDDLARRVML